ncbi:hypothetical protein RclHR1_09130006 [Rhizophagus clarus]|uniref:Uncharacterized protein n=1 Tax=Rhizophagus clarus TaxID=94130 RepID=A0A2Z6S3I7_9GLOM|nr:hypothetical protein RclHR1_09130006 [Rhizophagus clarus]GES88843.1 hypothetical protein GLOIN_2v1767828 [Rhizophagus clarus]
MNKFIKFTIGAIVALLIIEAISFAQALEVRAAEPEALNLAVRQAPEITSSGVSTEPTESADAADVAVPTDSKSLPIPSAYPTSIVNTLAKGTVNPSPTAYYSPTGTGSLIPSWSSLVAKGGVPSGQPTSAPTPPPSSPKSPEAPSSGHKIESGLFSAAVIAGIVGFFF